LWHSIANLVSSNSVFKSYSEAFPFPFPYATVSRSSLGC
jgi:hypothetical protein